ncbi:MAG: hypothetical protein JWR17_1990 [Pseudomonas sp.]|jgi:hypothetical protein|uniref:hypothetical protein n=1 Tax=Pseudomonas sp. TaxID=306 RepID=UPI002618FD65|nr:hypothetical protein [Pseudomonas sp.]MDB6049244.1 hypothetical protein [Pseudomonas sp.]
MTKVKVLAGDFLQGDGEYHAGLLNLETPLYPWPGISIPVTSLKAIEVATTGSNKKLEDAISLGLAGALMLGPLGAAAGVIFANEETEVTFWVTLKDGRRLLAATDDGTFREIERGVRRPGNFVSGD